MPNEINNENKAPEVKQIETALEEVKSLFTELKREQGNRLAKLEKGGVVPASIEEKINMLESKLTDADDAYQKLVDQQKSYAEAIKRLNQMEHVESKQQEQDNTEHKRVFLEFLRKGEDRNQTIERDGKRVDLKDYLIELQKKTLSAGSDPDGGYMIPAPVATRMVERVKETSPIRSEATIENTGIDEYTFLLDSGDVGFGWVGEHSTRPQTDTAKMQMGRVIAHEMYASPFATQKMLDDSGFDVENWLSEKVSDRFARAEATAFVIGSGVGQPRGFLTYPAGTSEGQIEQMNSGVASGITGDSLINLQMLLKGEYGTNAKWYMRRQTVGRVRLLKDTTGQYLWQPGLQAGEVASLLGDPIVKCADMPAVATNALGVVYGDMRRAYTIVDRMGIRVLRDPYSNKPYIQFYTTKRVGGAVVDTEAIKIMHIAE